MKSKKIILIEKSNKDILSDLVMCNAKRLMELYNITDFKRISYEEYKNTYSNLKVKVNKINLPLLLFLDNQKVINRLEGFQYLKLFE